ncbi:MAG: redoxin domain-containing protein [Deltaproteobacteria bacterium]|nr:redoxin domain-containing protein [Deltaproteobacteria bacterium]
MRNLQLQVGDKAHDFDFETPWSPRQHFYETSENKPAVLVFLRYQGCPVCQMEMANLKRDVGLFNQKDAQVFVFLQSTPEIVASSTNKED